MRQLPARTRLRVATTKRLERETSATLGAQNPSLEADIRYAAARRAVWFRPLIETLERLSGVGQRCMYCSGSEASQVEHYRPKAVYPDRTFEWDNLLWVCGTCNQFKGNRFDEGTPPINPIDDPVWEHFFIDEFGNLCAKWDSTANDLDPRAQRTIELLGLDREALQETRLARLLDLRTKISDAVSLLNSGLVGAPELQVRVLDWFEQPFQPDVADYFLDGPGSAEEPFSGFLVAAELKA